jgi:quercetin dioxygenase-like cupin family protein
MKKFLLGILVCAVAFQCYDSLALYANKDVGATPLLKTSTSWDGTALAYPTGTAELSALIVEVAPGGQTGWHLHTVPSVAVMLEGEIEVALKDGQVRKFKKGEAIAEVVNTLHNGTNRGSVPAKMAVFYVGTAGAGVTVSEDESVKPAL